MRLYGRARQEHGLWLVEGEGFVSGHGRRHDAVRALYQRVPEGVKVKAQELASGTLELWIEP